MPHITLPPLTPLPSEDDWLRERRMSELKRAAAWLTAAAIVAVVVAFTGVWFLNLGWGFALGSGLSSLWRARQHHKRLDRWETAPLEHDEDEDGEE